MAALVVIAMASLSPAAAKSVGGSIQPVAGWHIGGTVTASLTDAGTLAIIAHVQAPEAELVRPGGEANLLWNLVNASCAQVITATAGPVSRLPFQVLALMLPVPDGPGRQTVQFLVPRPSTGETLAVAAVVNGGGPLLACGEVPPVGSAGQLPDTGGALPPVPALFATVGIGLLLAGFGCRKRW